MDSVPSSKTPPAKVLALLLESSSPLVYMYVRMASMSSMTIILSVCDIAFTEHRHKHQQMYTRTHLGPGCRPD